ncbi:MAG: hypothetical protein Kow0062_28320 [Acidobacteriota bacterium]
MPTRKASSSKNSTGRSGLFEQAAAEYESAMKLFAARRDWKAAAAKWEEFVERYAGEDAAAAMVDRARRHLAACRERIGEEGGADLDPLLRAVLLVNAGRLDEALEQVERALAAGADRGRAYYVRATALSLAGRYDEAAGALAEAIGADPEYRAYALGDPDFERFRETAAFAGVVDPPRSSDRPEAREEAADGTAGSTFGGESF